MATSGLAVIFSGLTVIVSLAGLFMVDNTAIRSMALGAILVVAVVVARLRHAAAGADPAARPPRVRALAPFDFLRRFVTSPALRRPGSTGPGSARRGFWQRWTDARDAPSAPRPSSRRRRVLLRSRCRRSAEDRHRRAAPVPARARGARRLAALATVRGAGADGAGAGRRAAPRAPAGSAARSAADPEIARVGAAVAGARRARRPDLGQPRSDGESPAAKALVERLRRALPARRAGRRRSPRPSEDLTKLITGSMWKILLFLLGLSYLVLLRAAALGRAAAQGGADEPA